MANDLQTSADLNSCRCCSSDLNPPCQDRPPLTIDFSMAFQPIIDVRSREVFAYEALVRGLDGSGAAHILG